MELAYWKSEASLWAQQKFRIYFACIVLISKDFFYSKIITQLAAFLINLYTSYIAYAYLGFNYCILFIAALEKIQLQLTIIGNRFKHATRRCACAKVLRDELHDRQQPHALLVSFQLTEQRRFNTPDRQMVEKKSSLKRDRREKYESSFLLWECVRVRFCSYALAVAL